MPIKPVTNCYFDKKGGYAEKKYLFFGPETYIVETHRFIGYYGGHHFEGPVLSRPEYDALLDAQRKTPRFLAGCAEVHWWMFQNRYYRVIDEELDAQVVMVLIMKREERKRRRAERARETADDKPPPRERKSRQRTKTKSEPPWVTLGIPQDATLDEIKRAYRARAKEYHPDNVARLGPKLRQLAEVEMKKINGAYEILTARH